MSQGFAVFLFFWGARSLLGHGMVKLIRIGSDTFKITNQFAPKVTGFCVLLFNFDIVSNY